MIEAALKDILEKSIDCQTLIIENQSHLHAGHAGSPGTGESHFHVTVVASEFENLGRLERHRRVNDLVNPLFDKGLHALTLNLKDK